MVGPRAINFNFHSLSRKIPPTRINLGRKRAFSHTRRVAGRRRRKFFRVTRGDPPTPLPLIGCMITICLKTQQEGKKRATGGGGGIYSVGAEAVVPEERFYLADVAPSALLNGQSNANSWHSAGKTVGAAVAPAACNQRRRA